jgi:hypothetical protein
MPHRFPTYVTDGPFLYRTRIGRLLMLWSSFSQSGYTMGIALSESDEVVGPWKQQAEPLCSGDGGHGMVFRSFEGRLIATVHRPNRKSLERPCFFEVEDTGDMLRAVL